MILETKRLILRDWQDSDLEPFAAINADPKVMKYFPAPLDRAQSDAVVGRFIGYAQKNGFSFQPVVEKSTGDMIGMVGLNIPDYPVPFAPCVEIGWRLAHSAWGKGYASESALACLDWGFSTLGLKQVVSFTTAQNTPSQKVMQRIGMVRDPNGDFDHSMLPKDHPLLCHVLYRLDFDVIGACR